MNSGIYVHIPFCASKCAYCAFVSTPDDSLQRPYIDALVGEIAGAPERGETVDTVYIGGGTPSRLSSGELTRIFGAVRDAFDVLPNAEITVECNPESVNDRFISECLDCGVNRVSMGLQSSNDNSLAAVGRCHRYADYLRAVKLLSGAFDNISSDLILGLPEQTETDIKKSIKTISDHCDHASVYALSVEPGTPLCDSGYKTDDDRVADFYDLACETLISCGFERYEVSNFARNGRVSKHNRKYWQCLPYIGFGVAAHGYDGDKTRYSHTDGICEYISSPIRRSYKLTDKDKYNEYVMLRLRTDQGINRKEFEVRFGKDIMQIKGETINRLSAAGQLFVSAERVNIPFKFMFVMNGIIEELMEE